MNCNISVCWIALAGLLALGCGSDPKPEPTDPSDTGGAVNTAPAQSKKGGGDDVSPVGIDDKIAKMCNLPETRFDFDSASVAGTAKETLDKLATCFISGPAKGHGMKIIGHADERGETEYNFALGQRRAGSVAGYLTKQGVEETRIASSSAGELEATGTDASGWARDRKVEILLAE